MNYHLQVEVLMQVVVPLRVEAVEVQCLLVVELMPPQNSQQNLQPRMLNYLPQMMHLTPQHLTQPLQLHPQQPLRRHPQQPLRRHPQRLLRQHPQRLLRQHPQRLLLRLLVLI
jgi:hypothetical protein